jgi:hypothetical protein
VLGILSLVCCAVFGPFAWVMGSRARRDMADRPEAMWVNQGAVTAGWVCGIIGTVFMILGLLYLVVVLALVAGG